MESDLAFVNWTFNQSEDMARLRQRRRRHEKCHAARSTLFSTFRPLIGPILQGIWENQAPGRMLVERIPLYVWAHTDSKGAIVMEGLPTPTCSRAQANRDMTEYGYALIAEALNPDQVAASRERLVEQALAEGQLKGEERSIDDPHLRFDVGALLNKGTVFLEILDPDSLVFQVVGDTLEPSVEPRTVMWNLKQRFILGGLDGTVKRLEVTTMGRSPTWPTSIPSSISTRAWFHGGLHAPWP